MKAEMKKSPIHGNTLFLAPMAELTHGAFRLLISETGGCDYFYSEMLSAKAFINHNSYEKWYLMPVPVAEKLIYQLAGDEETVILKAAERLTEYEPFGIDINMGCSISHIIKKGWGLAWMKSITKASSLIRQLRNLLPDEIHVSAKLRIGYKADRDYLYRFASELENAGADFLILHPKTIKTPSLRPPDWATFNYLKQKLVIPLVANGMITSPEQYNYLCKKETVIPAMIGREAVKRPWIFRMLRNYDFAVNLLDISNRFLTLLQEYQPEDFWLSRCWRFYFYFTQNLMHGHPLFTSMRRFSRIDQFQQSMEDYFCKHPLEVFKTNQELNTA